MFVILKKQNNRGYICRKSNITAVTEEKVRGLDPFEIWLQLKMKIKIYWMKDRRCCRNGQWESLSIRKTNKWATGRNDEQRQNYTLLKPFSTVSTEKQAFSNKKNISGSKRQTAQEETEWWLPKLQKEHSCIPHKRKSLGSWGLTAMKNQNKYITNGPNGIWNVLSTRNKNQWCDWPQTVLLDHSILTLPDNSCGDKWQYDNKCVTIAFKI